MGDLTNACLGQRDTSKTEHLKDKIKHATRRHQIAIKKHTAKERPEKLVDYPRAELIILQLRQRRFILRTKNIGQRF